MRELQNALRRAIITGSGSKVELAERLRVRAPAAAPLQASPTPQTAPQPAATDAPQHASIADFTGMTLDQVERLAIEQAIARSSGNIVQAARALAVSPSTIYRKLERWGG